jgi:hypothetical protein
MTSAYTTNLKIQQIGNGEQSGVWGTTTNTNWTLIEQAVAGVVTINMGNADYTLTNLNGVSDEARNMAIVATGTNSAIRKIVAPLNQTKLYIVSNQTTGGYAITIGASTGSIVTIPNGVTAQVYSDGTNFYSAQTGSAGDFNVNGTLTASGIADVGNLTVSGTMGVTGNATVGGTLGVTGAATFASDSAFTSTGALTIPDGSTAQRPGTPTAGMIRFNNTVPTTFEGYDGVKWGSIGGGASGGGVVYENAQNLTTNYTMTTGYNGESVGPITIDSGVTVTIPSGSRWVIF